MLEWQSEIKIEKYALLMLFKNVYAVAHIALD